MLGENRQRIDKWLFFARVAKSRTLGGKLAASGKVRVNREKIDLPSHGVRPGDVLTITLERRVVVLRIIDGGVRRGPAEEARRLYEDLTPPPPPKEVAALSADPALRDAGSGRPTKKERRETDRFRFGE